MKISSRSLLCLTILLFGVTSFLGCSSFSFREFPRSKSKYSNISFHYPRDWKLQKEPYNEAITTESWLLKIPGHDSNINITIMSRSNSQEANDLFFNVIPNFFHIDPKSVDREEVEICGKEFEVQRFYQPDVYEDDFIIYESNDIVLTFINQNVCYIFRVKVLVPEQSSYAEIEEGFLSMVGSITCE